jgi:DNA polymerase/3'-5' exonuclease PolX
MNLPYAEACAARLVEWLAPLADRVEVAGSIRRRCQVVGDVDLVVIPKLVEVRDLLGEVVQRVNTTERDILDRAERDGWIVREAGDEIVIVEAKGVQVDFYFATPDTFGSQFLCRTGSRNHNIALASYANSIGKRWKKNAGVIGGRGLVPAPDEESVYRELGLPFIPPVEREARLLPAVLRGFLPWHNA